MEKFKKILGEIDKLFGVYNERKPLSGYEVSRIHPFDDCNGRVARILLNLILMRAGFPPIVIKVEERRKYLEALEQADEGQREPFYSFIAEHVVVALKAAS